MVSDFPKTWPGFFIVIDGIDGSGKSTQIKRLQAYYASIQMPCYVTAEPTQGDIGKILRKYLKDHSIPAAIDALLFAADRVDHCHKEILPHLQKGEIVITDRYVDSSLIYQSVEGTDQGIDIEWLRILNKFAIEPDLNIILDLDPEISFQRRKKDNITQVTELEKFENVRFLTDVRNGFLNIAHQKQKSNYKIIDATSSESDVFQLILNEITMRIQKKHKK